MSLSPLNPETTWPITRGQIPPRLLTRLNVIIAIPAACLAALTILYPVIPRTLTCLRLGGRQLNRDAWRSLVDTATLKTSLPWKKKKDTQDLLPHRSLSFRKKTSTVTSLSPWVFLFYLDCLFLHFKKYFYLPCTIRWIGRAIFRYDVRVRICSARLRGNG